MNTYGEGDIVQKQYGNGDWCVAIVREVRVYKDGTEGLWVQYVSHRGRIQGGGFGGYSRPSDWRPADGMHLIYGKALLAKGRLDAARLECKVASEEHEKYAFVLSQAGKSIA
jgi:hypothetical protein